MNDPALAWLLQRAPTQGRALWLCDEHFYGVAGQMPTGKNHRFIANRYDIVTAFTAEGLDASFSDYDCSDIEDQSLDWVIIRLCKEKPLAHYLIDIGKIKLKPGGKLLMAGLKNEGAKNLLEKAARQLGTAKATVKEGNAYGASLPLERAAQESLNNRDYPKLRAHPKLPDIMTKPGQFGWEKIDAGSALLIDTLQTHLQDRTPDSMLDIGCGYGYLTLRAVSELLERVPQTLTLTDNNAAAIASARANTAHLPNCSVIPADVAHGVKGRYQLVLCNPPFHQGFALSEDMTERFVRGAAQHTAPDGMAYFVVNAFIAAEQKSQAFFANCRTLANNRQFKVLAFSEPRV